MTWSLCSLCSLCSTVRGRAYAWNGAAARGLAGGQGAPGGRGGGAAGPRGRRPGCAVRHGHRQHRRTRRPVGAAGCPDPVAGRRDGTGSVDRVHHRSAPTRPETAPSASCAGAYDSGDRPVHRVSVGLGPGGVAVAGAGDDDVAARSARRRGDLAVAARPSPRLGPHERGLRSHRTAACSAGGGWAVVHEGGRDDSAQRVASAGGGVASAGGGAVGGGGVCGCAVVRAGGWCTRWWWAGCCRTGCCRTGFWCAGCCRTGCWCGRPWGLRPQTPIGPEGASSSNAGRAGFRRPQWKKCRSGRGQ